jgi:hypothetical protein
VSAETCFSTLKNAHKFLFRYFYGPIDGTPFSLGVAMPERYGLHEFVSQQEIRHSHVNGECILKLKDNLRS